MILPKIVIMILRIAGPVVIEHVINWISDELTNDNPDKKKLKIDENQINKLLSAIGNRKK